MILRRALYCAFAALLLAGCQSPEATTVGQRPVPTGPFDHTLFDNVLRTHVRDGMVDYRSLKDDPDASGALRQYLHALAEADPEGFPGQDDELAFWLNAYNAFVISAVLERYPDLSGVRDIPDFFRVTRWSAAGGVYSLDDIENTIIRPRFEDPRIHFILVCAAQSCPPLQPHAMSPDSLQDDLDRATRAALNDPRYVDLDPRTRTLRLTRLMSWYQEDFVESAGSLEAFLLRYLDEPTAGELRRGDCHTEFMDYDWGLNDAASPPTT